MKLVSEIFFLYWLSGSAAGQIEFRHISPLHLHFLPPCPTPRSHKIGLTTSTRWPSPAAKKTLKSVLSHKIGLTSIVLPLPFANRQKTLKPGLSEKQAAKIYHFVF